MPPFFHKKPKIFCNKSLFSPVFPQFAHLAITLPPNFRRQEKGNLETALTGEMCTHISKWTRQELGGGGGGRVTSDKSELPSIS